jgi:hypothetical protein
VKAPELKNQLLDSATEVPVDRKPFPTAIASGRRQTLSFPQLTPGVITDELINAGSVAMLAKQAVVKLALRGVIPMTSANGRAGQKGRWSTHDGEHSNDRR